MVSSYNVSSARTLLERVGPEYSMNKLRELGITEKRYVETPLPSNLSLGGDPMNMIETAGAFGTLANKGEYRQPISFTKVLDKDGNVILSNDNQRKLTVFKESTAFIITDILQEVVSTSAGTGRRAASLICILPARPVLMTAKEESFRRLYPLLYSRFGDSP